MSELMTSQASEPQTPTPAKRPRRRTVVRRAKHTPVVEAPPDKRFWVNHGPVLKDLKELRDALVTSISDEQFGHHVGVGKNDFATWVHDVLGDPKCATALRRARTQLAAIRALDRALSAAET